MKAFKSAITGHLDVFVSVNEETLDGETMRWNEVLIHGNPEGLRYFANLLLELADIDQESDDSLPVGARSHIHLRPNLELSKSSDVIIAGRLDAKGTGVFYERYISKENNTKNKK